MRSKKLSIITEGALMIAMATVLSYIRLWRSPYGGSVTLEMLPLIVFGLRRGPKWGLFVGFVHGLIQLIVGFEDVLYCNGIVAQALCVLLDYLLAFSCLGLAGLFTGKGENTLSSVVTGTVACGLLRYVCSFLSGWILWGSYAWEGWNPCLYSVVYNAIYMVPSIIIVTIVVIAVFKSSKTLLQKKD